jgi:hypothetical protein
MVSNKSGDTSHFWMTDRFETCVAWLVDLKVVLSMIFSAIADEYRKISEKTLEEVLKSEVGYLH